MAGENGHPHPPRLAKAVVAVVAAVVVALVAAGCGSDDDDALEGTPEDATATTTSTTVAPSTTAPGETDDGPATTADTLPADGVLVELNTSGGLDGQGIGSLVVTTEGVMRRFGDEDPVQQDALAPDELDALVVLLDDTDFAELPAEPDTGTACADAYVYTVRYADWTVQADDCTLPVALAPLLDRLQDLLARFD